MTTEEIKTVAREYARYTCSDISDAQERAIDENIECDFALPILEWLSNDYAIVPKSKLKEIDHIVCGTFSIGNMAVRQSWEYVKRKLFEEK